MRNTLILLTLFGVLIAGWSAAWSYVAGEVDSRIVDVQTRLTASGKQLECNERDVHGYPFRISISCDAVRYRNESMGYELAAAGFKSAAQAYAPGKAVFEVRAPASFTSVLNEAFDIDWSSLRGSLNANLDGVQRFSVVGKSLEIVPSQRISDAVALDDLQLHGRVVEQNDVDLAVRSLNVRSVQNHWAAFEFSLEASLKDSFVKLMRTPDLLQFARQHGVSGEIRNLEYKLVEGGVLNLSGPVQITNSGIVSGNFSLVARELPSLLDALAEGLPQQREAIQQVKDAAGFLMNASGGDELKLPLTVNQGRVSIGLIPVGQIPPLF